MKQSPSEDRARAQFAVGVNRPPDPVAPGGSRPLGVRRGSGRNTGSFRALNHPAFRLLFSAFLINHIGFWISHISLQGLMVELSSNDAFMNGLLFFILFIPAFLLAPLAGVAADRFDRKRIIIISYVSIAMASALLSLASLWEWLTPISLLVVACTMGISFTFASPASMAITATSVTREDLPSAIAMQSVANNLTRVAGPLLAAPLVALSLFEYAFLIYFATALVAAGLMSRMRVRPHIPDIENTGLFSRIQSGFSHARERHPAMPALLSVAVLSGFGASYTVLLPSFASEALGNPSYFPWLAAATGFGAMSGALVAGRSGARASLGRVALGIVAYGLTLVVFASTTDVWMALAAQCVVGFFYFSVMTRLQLLVQMVVDDNQRGRVMSLFQVCWAGTIPFGGLAMGFGADLLGTPQALLVGASLCTGYGFFTGILNLLEKRRQRLEVGSGPA